MSRLAVFVVFAIGACGGQHARTPCEQVPPPAECMQSCDPSPGAPPTCATGFHCSPDGKCDAQCTLGGSECGDHYSCSADGRCEAAGDNPDAGPDAACPAVHFTPTRKTPSIVLVLDRSYSMGDPFGNHTRYEVLRDALTGAAGAVTMAQANAYFGAALYSGDQTPCLNLANHTVTRALNNASAIDALIAKFGPGGYTPTAEAVAQVAADFAANPPPAGSPPIILLATDGLPTDGKASDPCGTDDKKNGPSIDAVKAANTAGIRTFVIGLANLNTQFLQDIANVGAGNPSGQAPNCATCAPYYTANDPTSLVDSFNSIISGVLSCDLAISGMVTDPAAAATGTVTLNSMPLTFGTDWTVDADGKTIHVLGAACTMLKTSPSASLEASFPCGAAVLL